MTRASAAPPTLSGRCRSRSTSATPRALCCARFPADGGRPGHAPGGRGLSPAPGGEPAELPHRGVLVVACGNTLRGDDAVGPEVGDLLTTRLAGTGASVIVSDQLLPELADDASRARLVVFVDAAIDRPVRSEDRRVDAKR